MYGIEMLRLRALCRLTMLVGIHGRAHGSPVWWQGPELDELFASVDTDTSGFMDFEASLLVCKGWGYEVRGYGWVHGT